MIYIVIESHMNGTITLENVSFGIEANSFIEAKNKLKSMIENKKLNVIYNMDDEICLSYNLVRNYYSDVYIHGRMSDEPLKIYN